MTFVLIAVEPGVIGQCAPGYWIMTVAEAEEPAELITAKATRPDTLSIMR